MMIHDSAEHVCKHCGKGFSTKGYLSTHEKRHGTKDIQCHICSKLFKTEEYLRKHVKRHQVLLNLEK